MPREPAASSFDGPMKAPIGIVQSQGAAEVPSEASPGEARAKPALEASARRLGVGHVDRRPRGGQ
jgi:hypothetical protein